MFAMTPADAITVTGDGGTIVLLALLVLVIVAIVTVSRRR